MYYLSRSPYHTIIVGMTCCRISSYIVFLCHYHIPLSCSDGVIRKAWQISKHGVWRRRHRQISAKAVAKIIHGRKSSKKSGNNGVNQRHDVWRKRKSRICAPLSPLARSYRLSSTTRRVFNLRVISRNSNSLHLLRSRRNNVSSRRSAARNNVIDASTHRLLYQ